LVPALIAVLSETFHEAEGAPTVIKLFFFGAIDAIEAWDRYKSKGAFETSLKKIGDALTARTGASLGVSHDAWLEWALERGYTVEGQNLVERLFSGFPERRRRAQDAGARLAGFAGRDDFIQKTPALAAAKEGDVSLELARRLLAKGLPDDER
jgi:hypothetical protein